MSKTKKSAASKAAILVYCGPSIPHVCPQYSMFSVIPDALAKKAEELPLIRSLIVPISDFAEARVKINGRRGAIFAVYQEVKNNI